MKNFSMQTSVGNGALSDSISKASRSYVVDCDNFNGYIVPREIVLSDDEACAFWKYNPWVNATVNRIVADVVKVPPIVKVRNQQVPSERQARRIKRIQSFLENPNNNDESFADIREKTVRDILIVGRGAMEKVYNDDKTQLLEIYSMVTKNLKIKCDEFGNIPMERAYKLESDNTIRINNTVKAKPQYFDRNEVIFITLQPVSWSMYGHKPMDTLAQTIASEILRDVYNSVFFTNNGEASGMFSLDGMNKTELKRFREYMQSRHRGAANAHRVMAVNVPVKWVSTSVTNRDMQFQEYGEELRKKIFAVFGMQPLIMGVLDSSTGRLNSEEQVQTYKDGAVKPILRKEAYYYTQEICWDGFGYDDLEIVFPEIDLLDAKTQSEVDRQDAGTAIVTINEIRARRKLPPVTWGDAPIMMLPGGGQIDPATGKIIMPDSNSADKKPAPKPKVEKKSGEEFIVSCKSDIISWCVTHYKYHDMVYYESLFGKSALQQYDLNLKQDLYVSTSIEQVSQILQNKKYGSIGNLVKKIDSIFTNNTKYLEPS